MMIFNPIIKIPGLTIIDKAFHQSSHVVTDVRQLRQGQHIYAFRFGLTYTHHGIYVGEGRVIHFLGPKSGGPSDACKQCRFLRKTQHGVVETCLDCFLCEGGLFVYQYGVSRRLLELCGLVHCPNCTTRESKPDFEVVQTAKQKLKEGFGTYDLLSHNCENFATFCKTGTSFCQQVRDFVNRPFLFF